MVAQAPRASIGAVGAKLIYADGHIQHSGFIMGIVGIAKPDQGEGRFLGQGIRFDGRGIFSFLKCLMDCVDKKALDVEI